MTRQSHAVEDVLDRLDALGREQDKVRVEDAVKALGPRGHGPLIFVPALLEITPVGAIPGIPTLLALIIAVVAVQMLVSRRGIRVPGFLGHRSVSGDKLTGADDKLRGVARWLDRWFPGRLPQLTGRPAARAAAVAILVLCLTVPPLELVPFASSAPMLAIATFGLALTLRDGVLMALGFTLTLVALGMGLGMIGGG